MRRKRRLRLRRSSSKNAGGSGRAGAGRNETERISGGADLAGRLDLNKVRNFDGERAFRDFIDRIAEDAERPNFDRDAYLKSMVAQGASKEMVEITAGFLDSRANRKMSGVVAIMSAIKDGRYEEAKTLVEEAERLGYNTSMYRYYILDWEGKMEELLTLCEGNIVGSAGAMPWIDAKAEILNEMGRAEERLELYEGTRKRFGEYPYWQAGRARALVGVGRLDEAEKIAIEVVESGEHLDIACIALGEALMARGNPEGAVEMFDRVLDMEWNDDRCCIGKAEALAAMGRIKEALEVCDTRLNRIKMSGRLKRALDRIRALADEQGPERAPTRTAIRRKKPHTGACGRAKV